MGMSRMSHGGPDGPGGGGQQTQEAWAGRHLPTGMEVFCLTSS